MSLSLGTSSASPGVWPGGVPSIGVEHLETSAALATDDWEPDQAQLVRPSATWTYLVHDNPFGSDMDRLVSLVGKGLRKSSE